MEIAVQKKTEDFDAELTRLRGDNESMTQRILALTTILETLVEAQVKNQDTTNTPSNLENPLLKDELKSPSDPTFTRMAGRLKFPDRDYSDDGSIERRVSIYA
jgi:hypothetical protein